MDDNELFGTNSTPEKEDIKFSDTLERDRLNVKDSSGIDLTDPVLAFEYNPRDEEEEKFLEDRDEKEKLIKEHEEKGLPPPRDWLEYTPLNKVKGEYEIKFSKDQAQREAVVLMVACGITNASIARILGRSAPWLKANYQRELDYGKDMLTIRVANAVVQKALDGNIPAAQLFLKARAGWKEATAIELSGPDGVPLISEVERNQRMLHILTSNSELREKLEQKRLAQTVDVTPEEVDIFN